MAHVTVNGIELHYDRVGEGPPLLLLHGLGSSARDWENQVSHFQGSREVIVPDFRGHGRSDKPDGPYSIEGLASDIAGLIDELGIGPAPVVGISLGGMVGFQLVADRPDLVTKLIAVNALPAFEGIRIRVPGDPRLARGENRDERDGGPDNRHQLRSRLPGSR